MEITKNQEDRRDSIKHKKPKSPPRDVEELRSRDAEVTFVIQRRKKNFGKRG